MVDPDLDLLIDEHMEPHNRSRASDAARVGGEEVQAALLASACLSEGGRGFYWLMWRVIYDNEAPWASGLYGRAGKAYSEEEGRERFLFEDYKQAPPVKRRRKGRP